MSDNGFFLFVVVKKSKVLGVSIFSLSALTSFKLHMYIQKHICVICNLR